MFSFQFIKIKSCSETVMINSSAQYRSRITRLLIRSDKFTYLTISPLASIGCVQLSFIELVVTLLMTGGLTPFGLSDNVETLMVGLLVHPPAVQASSEMLYLVKGFKGSKGGSPSSIMVDLLCSA